MSPAIFRLLKDVRPFWVLFSLLMVLTVAAIDGVVLTNPNQENWRLWLGGAIWLLAPTAAYPGRFTVWRALPVASVERHRAQWWACLGLPLTWVAIAMAGALIVARAAFGIRARALDVAAVAGSEVLAVTALVAAIQFGSALRRTWWLRGARTWFPLALACLVFGGRFLRPPSAGLLAGMGGLTFLLALLAYAVADRIGEALDRLGRWAASRPGAHAPAHARAAKGWAAMAPTVLSAWIMSAASGSAICYSANLFMSGRTGLVGPDVGLGQLMIVLLAWAIGGSGIPRTVRVLRGLPLGPATLTAVLQGFLASIAAAAFLAMWLVLRFTGGDTAQLSLFVVSIVPVLSLNLPLALHFGSRHFLALIVVPIVLVNLARLIPATAGPVILAGSALLTAALWVWTWWELARGRNAYRPLPRLLRWRGAAA
jgi:hypothetical protein